MNKNQNISLLDTDQMSRQEHDPYHDAKRVVIVGSAGDQIAESIKESFKDFKIDISQDKVIEAIQNIKLPEFPKEYGSSQLMSEIRIEQVQIPVIIKEIEFKEIEKIVIIPEIQIVEIQKYIEVPKIIEIEKPIIIYKKDENNLNKYILIAQTLILVAIVILSFRK